MNYIFDMVIFMISVIIVTYLAIIYGYGNSKRPILKHFCGWSIISISFLLMSHRLPYFKNILLYDSVLLDDSSSPFSLKINFDKPLLCLLFLNYYEQDNPKLSYLSFKKTIQICFLAIISLILPAYILGYIKLSVKVPEIFKSWILLNFITICAEEIFFRGFLQTYIWQLFDKSKNLFCQSYSKYLSLFATSILFGLSHYQGGLNLIMLSFVAGIYYGLAFIITSRIESSIVVHFVVNLCHILLFSYPALKIN